MLISSADGVGTKIKLAFLTGVHSTVGEDLVNHCVNDIAVQGADPLYFLDYFSVGKLNAKVAARWFRESRAGCKANGCALIGGETAEMPGLYAEGEYDLAGFITGAVERKRMITGASIKAGDVLLGLPSTLHFFPKRFQLISHFLLFCSLIRTRAHVPNGRSYILGGLGAGRTCRKHCKHREQ